jgi:hypothetical protein
MNFRFKHIAGTTIFLGLLAGGAMLAPFATDAIRAPNQRDSADISSREANASRFGFEAYLVGLGKEPLDWDCRSGQPNRARFFRNSCFAEHILEFEQVQVGRNGVLQLTAREEAVFLSAEGTKLLGRRHLTASQSDALIAMLARRLPRIPSQLNAWQMPSYEAAMEACIAGESFFAIRNIDDPEFEAIAGDFVSLAGVTLSRTAPGMCM